MKTPRSYNTIEELNASILRDYDRVTRHLSDSPKSQLSQLMHLRAFYWGYCDAMQWDEDRAVVDKLTNQIETL